MAAARITRPPKSAPPVDGQQPHLFRITVDQYHEMGRAGILSEKDRCVLIRGVLVEKPVIHPPHSSTLRKLEKLLRDLLGPDAVIAKQDPITLPPDSEPEPDLVIATGVESDYERRHPGPKEVLLVAEVADSSLEDDRTSKLSLYASHKLPVYWNVNVRDRRVEVYTHPKGGKSPTYRTRTDHGPDDSVPVALAGKSLGSIPVRELLP